MSMLTVQCDVDLGLKMAESRTDSVHVIRCVTVSSVSSNN